MQLPAWVYSGSDVLYVYKDGGDLMMEVYRMDGNVSQYQGTQYCSHDVRSMQTLESPWKDVMEKRRRSRLQGIRDSGQPKLF